MLMTTFFIFRQDWHYVWDKYVDKKMTDLNYIHNLIAWANISWSWFKERRYLPLAYIAKGDDQNDWGCGLE